MYTACSNAQLHSVQQPTSSIMIMAPLFEGLVMGLPIVRLKSFFSDRAVSIDLVEGLGDAN
jgi:hypothetical protein